MMEAKYPLKKSGWEGGQDYGITEDKLNLELDITNDIQYHAEYILKRVIKNYMIYLN